MTFIDLLFVIVLLGPAADRILFFLFISCAGLLSHCSGPQPALLTLSKMASLLIPNLLPLILPAALNYLPIPARYRNDRRLLIGGLSLYIIYTFASAELPNWSRPTFYQLLNLPRNVAEWDGAIRDGWKLWARKNHPDRGGSPDMFVVARKAYDIIGDDVKRWAYDRFVQTLISQLFSGLV